eukprot:6206381-Pleurochrysis_carterae.AAC.1
MKSCLYDSAPTSKRPLACRQLFVLAPYLPPQDTPSLDLSMCSGSSQRSTYIPRRACNRSSMSARECATSSCDWRLAASTADVSSALA